MTGLQLNSINDTETSIGKATDAWIKQYKIRAKSEAIIRQIVQNELDFEKAKSEFLDPKTEFDRRKEIAATFNLTGDQMKLMLDYQQIYKSNVDATTKKQNYDAVLRYLDVARQNMIANNEQLEKQINIESLIVDKKEKGIKTTKDQTVETKKQTETLSELLKLREQLYERTIVTGKQIGRAHV